VLGDVVIKQSAWLKANQGLLPAVLDFGLAFRFRTFAF
jgi:hypothetical protein